MNLRYLITVLCCICSLQNGTSQTHDFCKTEEKDSLNVIDNWEPSFQKNGGNTIFYLRTVVHLLYSEEAYNHEDNVIFELIEKLNILLRAEDVDLTKINPIHHSKISGTKIQLCLATENFEGEQFNGITRKKSFKSTFSVGNSEIDTIKTTNLGGINPWNTSRHLNIWIAPISNANGYAVPYPDFEPLSLITKGIPGIVIDEILFNEDTEDPPHKILAHEFGHLFGLLHIFGLVPNQQNPSWCTKTDFINDTPSCEPFSPCLKDAATNTCIEEYDDEPDNVSNVMNIACLEMFTNGQAELMYNNLLNFAPPGLFVEPDESCEVLSSTHDQKLSNIKIYPNPASDIVHIESTDIAIKEVKLFNVFGQEVLSHNPERYNYSLDLADLEKGIYFISIRSDKDLYKVEKVYVR